MLGLRKWGCPNREATVGRLSTHVLDLSTGRPASGMGLRLVRLDNGAETVVTERTTNKDGRTDEPLLTGDAVKPGVYVLTFFVRAYFEREAGDNASPFLDEVPIRFCIADAAQHYHVPLLTTPWSFSTYRGS